MMLWFTARGAGLSALVLLSFSTCLGALMTRPGSASGRVVWHYVHRVSASLGLGVLALHVATILADPYAKVGWRAALIPFTAQYRPTWVGLGTLAVYTFVLVAAVGAARGRFAATPRGAATWRILHSLAYVGWAMAMWHGFLSGTDSSVPWVRALYIASAVAVVASVAVRLRRTSRPGLQRHRPPVTAPADSTSPAPALVGAR
jgi:sulfoxide reductase heme-binding subunit YedZ